LVFAEGVDGKHDRTDDAEPQVRPRPLVEDAELGEPERHEDRDRPAISTIGACGDPSVRVSVWAALTRPPLPAHTDRIVAA
jgi:hypothetical protein